MSDHVVVRIGKNAQKYHRPAGDDNTKPACWVTEKDDPDTEYTKSKPKCGKKSASIPIATGRNRLTPLKIAKKPGRCSCAKPCGDFRS